MATGKLFSRELNMKLQYSGTVLARTTRYSNNTHPGHGYNGSYYILLLETVSTCDAIVKVKSVRVNTKTKMCRLRVVTEMTDVPMNPMITAMSA